MLAKDFISQNLFKESSYKFALIYYYDRIIFEPVQNIDNIETDYLIQGWVFGPWKQAYLFKNHNGLQCKITDSSERKDEILFEEEQLLDSRFSHLGKAIVIKKFGVEDDDGQVHIDDQLIADIVR